MDVRPVSSTTRWNPAARSLIAIIVGAAVCALAVPATAANWRVVAWNNLGMHCMDGDYSVLSLLPPFNTIHAQLIDPQGRLVTNPVGVTVTYEAVADPSGSINRTSQGKTNFWQYMPMLFGVTLPVDTGLAGSAMPGLTNVPQPMTFDPASGWFVATGIPITPYDDAGHKSSYSLMRVVARDSGGVLLASADIVLPVSDEMDCSSCHASGGPPAARPAAGWANDPDAQRDFRLNIVRRHDDRQLGDPAFQAALAAVGYNAAGLYQTVVSDGKPILCAGCHSSEALGTGGQPGTAALTLAIHGMHSDVTDPVTGLALGSTNNRSACYRCHPGAVTRCLRGVMGASVAADGTLAIQCQDCHGSMSAVASPARTGWLNEPLCQSCHTGTAIANSGLLRYTTAFDGSGQPRAAVDPTFATTPDAPAAGLSLYRFSTGHGGLKCESCHGSTHAEFTSSERNDNIESIAQQGHAGMLVECDSCHGGQPSTINGGPHGMHPLGQSWVGRHPDAVQQGGSASCRACHGADYRGTVLSRVKGDRTLALEGGAQKQLWRGFQVGCYTCHLGPGNGDNNPNRAAIASNASASTTVNSPVTIHLGAHDPDGNSLTLRIVSQPQHGTVGLAGTLADYFPEDGFSGTDAFTFAAWDGSTDSNLATVTVSVGVGTCTFTITPTSQAFGVAGGTDSVAVMTSTVCGWTASSNASWVTIDTGSSGRGNGAVVYTLVPNPDAQSRSGTLIIAGQTFTVMQAGSSGADLTGNWVNLTQTCVNPGARMRCTLVGSLQITNQGTVTPRLFRVRYYLSSDPILSADDQLLRRRLAVVRLTPGKIVTKVFRNRLPFGQSASGMYVIADLDATHLVVETNESNNTLVCGPLP